MYPGCRTDTLVMGSAPSPHVSSPNREARGEGRMDIGVDSVPAVRGAGLGRGGDTSPSWGTSQSLALSRPPHLSQQQQFGDKHSHFTAGF